MFCWISCFKNIVVLFVTKHLLDTLCSTQTTTNRWRGSIYPTFMSQCIDQHLLMSGVYFVMQIKEKGVYTFCVITPMKLKLEYLEDLEINTLREVSMKNIISNALTLQKTVIDAAIN